MANYSRTDQYTELRDQLQHDTGSPDNISTPELSRFEKRLNRIDPNSFAAPDESQRTGYISAHAKNETPVEEIHARISEETKTVPAFDFSVHNRNENDSSPMDDDLIGQYINEVKEYNYKQGNAVSENTTVNVLSQIEELSRQSEKEQEKVTSKPYQPKKKKQQKRQANDTADIPFMTPFRRYDDDYENTEKRVSVETHEDNISSTQTMSKEDIMAEVQNLVNGQTQQPVVTDQSYNEQLSRDLEDDRETRARLLNETTQMRAQLDGYEDNLSEVNDKMRYTNRILNLVLIVLIIALIIILFILIYWVVLSRGA